MIGTRRTRVAKISFRAGILASVNIWPDREAEYHLGDNSKARELNWLGKLQQVVGFNTWFSFKKMDVMLQGIAFVQVFQLDSYKNNRTWCSSQGCLQIQFQNGLD